MTNPEQPKRESSIVRIVGATPEDERAYLNYFKNVFENQPVEEFEREKTGEEVEVIWQVNGYMQEFISEYGGEPIDIPPANIHLLDTGKMPHEIAERAKMNAGTVAAAFDIEGQRIYFPIESQSRLAFVQNLAHEELHVNSFSSLSEETGPDGSKKVHNRRGGFRIFVRKEDQETGLQKEEKLFADLDEAVIEELVKRFDKKYMEHISYVKDELPERQEAIEAGRSKDPDFFNDLAYTFQGDAGQDGTKEIYLVRHAYATARQELKALFEMLFDANPGIFKDHEEVFDLFARAVISGRLLPLARLVEKTFGKGAFRSFGEMTKKKNDE